MKSSLVKINQFTPLLTDTLPYEVPFFFSNIGFYSSLKNSYDGHFREQNLKKSRGQQMGINRSSIVGFFVAEYFCHEDASDLKKLIEKMGWNRKNPISTIPYDYQIKKGSTGYRTVSLIHPVEQIRICDFYKEYKNLILFYCSRSQYSIRYPSRVTSRVVRKRDDSLRRIFSEAEAANTSDVREQVVDDNNAEISLSDLPSSYFVLQKYKMIHEFYDSFELLDLEKKFTQCLRFDVKRCFESIYTHSISWAVKGKEHTKKNLTTIRKANQKPFEAEFDKLMQLSNYNETHGIPIGSETSRIFSEIILQRVDLSVQNSIEKLSADNNLTRGQDFDIRRYMDDFFIFANESSIAEQIQQIYENSLKDYKLFVNESKTVVLHRPFITPTSSAKQKITVILWDYLNKFGLRDGAIKHQRYSDRLRVINKIRGVVYDHKLSFYDITNIALSILKIDLLETLKKMQLEANEESQKDANGNNHSGMLGYLKNIIGIAFYVFRLSPRAHTASTIFKIGYITLEIAKRLENKEVIGEIKQDLSHQNLIFCEEIANTQGKSITEFLDIILFLEVLGDEFKMKENRLKKIFNIKDNGDSSLSYFECVSLLSYIKRDNAYDGIRDSIAKICENKLSVDNSIQRTENFLLFFDLIKCPYLEVSDKEKILEHVGIKSNQDKTIRFIEGKKWFFDWDKQEKLDLVGVLTMKVMRTGY